MIEDEVVYIGLGSNVGDGVSNIAEALRLLSRDGSVRLEAVSSLYLTSPVGPRQDDFVNAAARCRTGLDPLTLLSRCKEIERSMGRIPGGERWGPRIIDLDILLYDELTVASPGLEIPHPRLHLRRFVLEPLCELAPDLIHPRLGRTIRELLSILLLTYPGQTARILNIVNIKSLEKL